MKIFLAILLFSMQSFAAFPPTTSRGQSQAASSATTTFNYVAPYNQFTKITSIAGLIENGYENFLVNPNFEALVSTTDWTAGTGVVPTLDTTNVYSGKQAVSLALTAANGWIWYQDVTPTVKMSGQPLEFGKWIYGNTLTNLQLCARNAGAVVGTCQQVPVNSGYQYVVLNISAPSSGSVGVGLFTTSAATGTFSADNAYVGYARNLSQVSQAYFFGGMEQAGASGCFYAENTSTGLTDFVSLGAGSGCNAWTAKGGVTATGTNDHRPIINNGAAGYYTVELNGQTQSDTTNQICNFRLSDGTNTYQPQSIQPGSAGQTFTNILRWHLDYSAAAPGTKTLTVQAADNQGGNCDIYNTGAGFNLSWKVYYFPSQSQLALAANTPSAPQITTLTSGTAQTYTVPKGATYLRVRGVGGGSGGWGSGASAGSTPTAGGDTTFGSLLTAGGGQIASTFNASQGGSPGNVTITSPAVGSVFYGSIGGAAVYNATSGAYLAGGTGGAGGLFGGAGAGGVGNVGSSAYPNSGGAGGGGGTTNVTANGGAAGGGGSAFDAIISSPSASYTYTVGAAGTAGTAGSLGSAGGSGGSGYIEVTAYFGAQNVPLLIGSVTSLYPGNSQIISARVGGASATTVCSASPCTVYNGVGISSVTRSSTGTYLVTPTNPNAAFVCNGVNAGNGADFLVGNALIFSGTTISVTTGKSSTEVVKDSYFDILCFGPR